jgi:hypothetical protein
LLARWRRKDERLARFYKTGALDASPPVATLPVELRSWTEVLSLFTGALPGLWLCTAVLAWTQLPSNL